MVPYPEWKRRIKLILEQEGKLYILDAQVAPINQHGSNANPADVVVWEQRVKDKRDSKYLMLVAMSSDLSEQHKGMTAREIYVNLQGMFKKSDIHERFQCSNRIFKRAMAHGGKVETHVQETMKDVQRLRTLGFEIPNEIVVDMVLSSLPNSYTQFVINFNMNRLEATLPELMAMLKQTEVELLKAKGGNSAGQVLAVTNQNRRGKEMKGDRDNSDKKEGKPKPSRWFPPKGNEADSICFKCNNKGH